MARQTFSIPRGLLRKLNSFNYFNGLAAKGEDRGVPERAELSFIAWYEGQFGIKNSVIFLCCCSRQVGRNLVEPLL